MKRNEFLDAYAGLTVEDRAAVRAEILRAEGLAGAPGVGSAMAACIEIMEEVKAGRDPIETCKGMLDEMAAMCCQ